MYQFYVAEKKDEVFAGLKKNKKITKENIPAATQLFTPKWIVQYMVENSVGRLWQESHPESQVSNHWQYYLPPVEQEPEVQQKLDSLRNPNLKPEEITIMDLACGSGHILVYAFDVLYQIYTERGYLAADIPSLILKNNLFGLEIDDRAAQLASFALLMKARGKDANILQKSVLPNIISIQESHGISDSFAYAKLPQQAQKVADELISTYKDAKNYGSILNPQSDNLDILSNELSTLQIDSEGLTEYGEGSLYRLETLVKQTELLTRKYDVVITNPPYMGSRGMNAQLSDYLKENYPDSKADLFAVFLERTIQMTKHNGAIGSINQHSWMFLSSYEKLRIKLLDTQVIQSMLHLGPRAFDEIGGEVVQSVAFVLRNLHIPEYKGEYHRLIDLSSGEEKRLGFLRNQDRYIQKGTNFHSIPGSPIAYWISNSMRNVFDRGVSLGQISQPRKGNSTSNNKRFLRQWYEVSVFNINFGAKEIIRSETLVKRWFPYNKGGGYRKWYGNQEFVIDWKDDAREIREIPTAVIANYDYFTKPGLTWSTVSSGNFSIRWFDHGFIFDNGGCCLFTRSDHREYYIGLLNSIVFRAVFSCINPTLNYQSGDVAKFPVLWSSERKQQVINDLVHANLVVSMTDWDSFETSWDFQRHPLLVHKNGSSVEQAYERWEAFAEEQFQKLKANEEELNRIFIEIYGLEDELTPEVEDVDVTIRRADRERDIKSFISYAVGCMFGRYSLDEDGLVFAGGEFDPGKYKSFEVVENNILPILDDRYFEDDIVSRFVDFVEVTFGTECLEQNLDYVAGSIGRRNSESAREAIRRYFLRDFYKDHVRVYKKRPIYWLFRSPSGTFNALIYLHRYDQDTVSRIRTDYLLAFQDKLAAEDGALRQLLSKDLTQREKTRVNNRLKEIDEQMAELREYHQLIHHLADERISLDLDDGVVVNYAKFGDALAKI